MFIRRWRTRRGRRGRRPQSRARPPGAARVATSNSGLAAERLVVERPSPVTTANASSASSKPIASSTQRRAGPQLRCGEGPEARRRDRRPRRPSARPPGRAGRRARRPPPSPAAAARAASPAGSAPFCGSEDAAAPSGPEQRVAHVARDPSRTPSQPRAQLREVRPVAREVARRAPPARHGRRRSWRCRRPPRSRSRRPGLDRGGDQLARCRGSRRPTASRSRRPRATARRLRHLDDRGAPAVEQPERGLTGRPSGSARPRPRAPDRRARHQRLHRALAAVGDRQQLDRLDAPARPARGRSPARPPRPRACP